MRLFFLLLAVAMTPALADSSRRIPANPAWVAECGSCHVAYPPKLLPAQSWKTIMGRLERHFGSDASLDERTAGAIAEFLARHAGRRAAPSGAEPRITETRWFVHEHDEVPAALWKSAAVKSAANCAACHRRAADLDYSERTLRLPR